MKFYLAGPMTNIPQFNFPEFDRVTAILRNAGYTIVSPAELDTPETRKAALASSNGSHEDIPKTETWGRILARDVAVVADEVDGIVLLPNWQKSRGARLECFVGLLCAKGFFLFNESNAVANRRLMPYLTAVTSDYIKGQIL